MRVIRISKLVLSVALLASLTIGLVQFFSLDVADENFGNSIISGTFFLSFFVLCATYRIDWIGKQKINWITLVLFLLTSLGLLFMLISPKNVMALWKPTVAAYVLLSSTVFFYKIQGKNWSGIATKVLLAITSLLFLYPLLIQTTDALFYQVSWYFLLSTGLLAVIHLLLPEKQS
ncbi:MAG: hypothetical protein NXI10_09995 [bacterium]|nr:hypothetical protein [bacterium]